GRLVYPSWLVSGILAGMVLMTRAAIFPGAILICALAFFIAIKRTAPRKAICGGALLGGGILLVIGLWAAFCKISVGSAYLCPQRVPAHNFFIGWDFAAQGFGTYPETPQTRFNSSNLSGELVNLWLAEPERSFHLVLRKVARLYRLPWNDLRRRCLGMPTRLQ